MKTVERKDWEKWLKEDRLATIKENKERIFEMAEKDITAKCGSETVAEKKASDEANKFLNSAEGKYWSLNFCRFAGNACVEDLQRIWAKILAAQFTGRANTSVRTMHEVSLLSQKEMKLIFEAIQAFGDDKHYEGYREYFAKEYIENRTSLSGEWLKELLKVLFIERSINNERDFV